MGDILFGSTQAATDAFIAAVLHWACIPLHLRNKMPTTYKDARALLSSNHQPQCVVYDMCLAHSEIWRLDLQGDKCTCGGEWGTKDPLPVFPSKGFAQRVYASERMAGGATYKHTPIASGCGLMCISLVLVAWAGRALSPCL